MNRTSHQQNILNLMLQGKEITAMQYGIRYRTTKATTRISELIALNFPITKTEFRSQHERYMTYIIKPADRKKAVELKEKIFG